MLENWLLNKCDKLRHELDCSSYNYYEKMKMLTKIEAFSEILSKIFEGYINEIHMQEIQEIEERYEEEAEEACVHTDDCTEENPDPLLMSAQMIEQYCKAQQECGYCKFYDDEFARCLFNVPAPYNWDLNLVQKNK